jgi:hypothetical protein
MALYDVVNGVYRKVSKKYDPVDGVYRKVKKAYDPVDGVYREYFSGGPSVSTLAVGSSVWLNVNGTLTEFLVVHQGRPSTLYHSSCNGTWLLMKDIYENRTWDSTNNDYANSDIHAYLNGTFLKLFSTKVQSAIRQARIPYMKGTADTGTVASGSSGLSTKIFLLAGYELGLSSSTYLPVDGAKLDYFTLGNTMEARTLRIGYMNGTSTKWMLRSPYVSATDGCFAISSAGLSQFQNIKNLCGVRPALILDSNTILDNSTGKNIIA